MICDNRTKNKDKGLKKKMDMRIAICDLQKTMYIKANK